MPDELTAEEVMAHLDISRRTVQRLTRRQVLHPHRYLDGRVRYSREEVERIAPDYRPAALHRMTRA